VTNVEGINRWVAIVASDAHHAADIRLLQQLLEHVNTEYAVASDDGDPSETQCHVTSPIRIALVLAAEDYSLGTLRLNHERSALHMLGEIRHNAICHMGSLPLLNHDREFATLPEVV
jgi:hypothetical protein